MKEEVKRIMRLVQEGKLSPEDAAELIDAFSKPDHEPGNYQEAGGATEEPSKETPPTTGTGEATKDPLKGFVDFVEGIGKEVTQSVNWHEVASQIRKGTQKSVEELKKAAEGIRGGKINFGWFNSHEVKEITLPLSVPEGKTLIIENPCGTVKVASGFEEGTVAARATVHGGSPEDARAKADAYTMIVEESDHAVTIRQPDSTGLSVDLVVQLTAKTFVEIKTESGDIHVLDTGDGCRINSSSGDVQVRGLNGTVEINMQSGDIVVEDSATTSLALANKSGDITIKNVQGNVNARTASGDVNVREFSGKTLSVESVSGDVSVDIFEPVSGSVNIRTVNGEAKLEIPDGCDCRVRLSTLRGDVNCEVELDDESKLEQRITGRLGEGTGMIDVSAINGDISVTMRDSGTE